MKKFFMATIAALAMVSCSNNDCVDNYTESSAIELGTETRMSLSSSIAKLASENIKETAYFYIRIDNRIPGVESFKSTLYFPQDVNGGTLFGSNKGIIKTDGVDWKYLNNKITKYLYDTTGKTTTAPLSNIPSIETLINAHQNNKNYNLSNINPDTLHIIWYVTKYENNVWHVDGVLTGKSTTNTDSIPNMNTKGDNDFENDAKEDTVTVNNGSVEVNLGISDSIKDGQVEGHLSVHVRDTTDFEIFMPIAPEYYCKNDDMMIVAKHDKSYTYKTKEESVTYNIDGNEVKFTVTYGKEGITVKSEGVNANILKYLRDTYQDGLTFEIRNYYNVNSLNSLTEELNKSTIKFTNNPTYYIQAIGKYQNILDKYPIYVKIEKDFKQDSIVDIDGRSKLIIFKRN